MKLTIENYKTIEPYLRDERQKAHYSDLDSLLSDTTIHKYYGKDAIITEEINEAIKLFNELIDSGEINIPEPEPELITEPQQKIYPHSKLSDRPKDYKKEYENRPVKKAYISPQSRANLLESKSGQNKMPQNKSDIESAIFQKLDPQKHYIVKEAKRKIGDILNEKAIRNYGSNVFARELMREYNRPEHFKMTTIKEVLRAVQSFY